MEQQTLRIRDKRILEEPEMMDVVPTQQNNSPASMMAIALNKGVDIDRIEKMLELQERWEANEAKKAYYQAMALFSQTAPEIVKDRKVDFGSNKAKYSHASLANVTNSIRAELGKYGLSPKWITVQDQGIITVTCTITHELGYSESTSLSAAPDSSGNKNSIQAVGSTITYLERYTILALTGLATKDMDDDGKGYDPPEYITENQVKQIEAGIKEKSIPSDKYLELISTRLKMEIKEIKDIPVKHFNGALDIIKRAKGPAKAISCPEKDGKDALETECKSCKMRKGCPSWE